LFKPCCGILFSGSVNNPLFGNSYIRGLVWYLSFRYYRVCQLGNAFLCVISGEQLLHSLSKDSKFINKKKLSKS